MLKTKSVWSPPEKSDGLRLLVSRFRGRGMPRSRYDVWMPALGPSERSLKAFQSGRVTWSEFSRRYRNELFMDGPVDSRSPTIKNHGRKFALRLIKHLSRQGAVTLMCQCAEDEELCHRHLLRRLIESARI
jgi:uncharacterized protein YeaO (DUF488 family)